MRRAVGLTVCVLLAGTVVSGCTGAVSGHAAGASGVAPQRNPDKVVAVSPGPDLTTAARGKVRPARTVLGTGRPGKLDARLAAARQRVHGRGSLLADITVPGRRTGYRYGAEVYLPAAYFARSNAHRTFPVVEVLAGSRADPGSLFRAVSLQSKLDRAIAAGTMPPVIAIGPTRNAVALPDEQCLDNPHGYKMLTYLADDVPQALPTLLRARTDRGGWATMGSSSGGYCAANIAVRRPQQFSSVLSLSGYFSGAINRGKMSDPSPTAAERRANAPLYQITKVTQPMSFVLVSARNDTEELQELRAFARVLRDIPADHVTTFVTASGGHSAAAWLPWFPQIMAAFGHDIWQHAALA